MAYINITKMKRLVISPGKELAIFAWTDASYSNHLIDQKGQSGILVSLGYNPNSKAATGFITASSKKQKITAQSSAEAEIIAQAEVVKWVLWTKFLLEALGCGSDRSVATIFQDNMSTIQMANAGHGSFKKSKHINQRFFLIHEHVVETTIRLEHCPTELMVADILTKPPNGSIFKHLTSLLLNEKESEMNEVMEA